MGQAHFPVRVRQETPNQRPPSLPCRSLRERLASPAADGFVVRRVSGAGLPLPFTPRPARRSFPPTTLFTLRPPAFPFSDRVLIDTVPV
jgi:hypothetical protein